MVIDNLTNFLSISPNQTKFLPTVCLVPGGLFCHYSKRRLQRIQNVQERKRHWKKRHQIFKLPNLSGNQLITHYLLLSLFLLFLGISFQQLNFEWYRQKLLAGKWKKVAIFLIRTFTCRSTFLYNICTLSCSEHCNFVRDGNQPGLIFPSWWNVRQKAAIATLCVLWGGEESVSTKYIPRRTVL